MQLLKKTNATCDYIERSIVSRLNDTIILSTVHSLYHTITALFSARLHILRILTTSPHSENEVLEGEGAHMTNA